MEELSCKICYEIYDALMYIPKILPCGHTFCGKCLQKILKISKKCAFCRGKLTNPIANSYHNNFALISIIESGAKFKKKKFKKFNEKSFSGIITRANIALLSLDCDLTEKRIQRAEVKKGKELIEKMSSKTGKKPRSDEDVVTFLEILNDLEEEIYAIISPEKSSASKTLNLDDFQHKHQYLKEIQERLKKKQTLAAVHKVGGVELYGKVTQFEGDKKKILVHCLQEITPPAGTALLKFVDLKKCSLTCESTAFLVFRNTCNLRMTFIDVVKTSSGRRFVQLCTGEFGSSYKFCTYYGEEDDRPGMVNPTRFDRYKVLLKVVDNVEANLASVEKSGSEEKGASVVGSGSEGNVSVYLKEGATVVRSLGKGNFDVLKCNRFPAKISSVIGFVPSTERFRFDSINRIANCGIVLNVE